MLLPQLAQAVPDGTIDRTPSARSETSGRLNRSNDSRRFLYPRSPSGIDSQRCHVIFVQPWSLILLNGVAWQASSSELRNPSISRLTCTSPCPLPHPKTRKRHLRLLSARRSGNRSPSGRIRTWDNQVGMLEKLPILHNRPILYKHMAGKPELWKNAR